MHEADPAEDLPPPSLPEGFRVTIREWQNANEAEARAFGEHVWALTELLSRTLDLSRLEAVILTWNYRDAVTGVDRGGLPSAAPTANEYGEGGAMSLHVLRDGEVWNVVVLGTSLARHIFDPNSPEHGLATHVFVHELTHVHDLRVLTRTYPGGIGAMQPRDGREAELLPILSACQSEYTAQRLSAHLAPEQGFALLDMLEAALRDIDQQIWTARLRYPLHRRMDVYWSEIEPRLRFLFQTIGYALGHTDWAATFADEHTELAMRYRARLEELGRLPSGWLIDACRPAVQPFFLIQAWTGMEIYDPLLAVLEEFLSRHGMYTRSLEGRMYMEFGLP